MTRQEKIFIERSLTLKAIKYLRKKIALANLQNTSLSKSLKKILRTFELHIELDNQFFRRSFLNHFISFEVRCKMLFPKKYFFVRVNLTELEKSMVVRITKINKEERGVKTTVTTVSFTLKNSTKLQTT